MSCDYLSILSLSFQPFLTCIIPFYIFYPSALFLNFYFVLTILFLRKISHCKTFFGNKTLLNSPKSCLVKPLLFITDGKIADRLKCLGTKCFKIEGLI